MENEPDNDAVPQPPQPGPGEAVYPNLPPASPTYGSMRFQEPGVTQPRPPTVAEARARDKAQKAREAADRFAAEQAANAARKRKRNRNTLMGAVAVVGVVGAVAVGYQLLKSPREITATCVDANNVVVPDNYCSSGVPGSGGTFIYAGSPYRYYYGGTTSGIGSRATGGTLEQPSGTTARTKSGSTISRGGFGSSSSGSSGS